MNAFLILFLVFIEFSVIDNIFVDLLFIISLVGIPLISLIGTIFGFISLNQFRKNSELNGKVFMIVGLIINGLIFLLILYGVYKIIMGIPSYY